jgi:hypothetical protein
VKREQQERVHAGSGRKQTKKKKTEKRQRKKNQVAYHQDIFVMYEGQGLPT